MNTKNGNGNNAVILDRMSNLFHRFANRMSKSMENLEKKIENLERKVEKLDNKIDDFKKETLSRLDKVEQRLEKLEGIQLQLEQTLHKKTEALFDGYDLHKNKLKDHDKRITRLEEIQ